MSMTFGTTTDILGPRLTVTDHRGTVVDFHSTGVTPPAAIVASRPSAPASSGFEGPPCPQSAFLGLRMVVSFFTAMGFVLVVIPAFLVLATYAVLLVGTEVAVFLVIAGGLVVPKVARRADRSEALVNDRLLAGCCGACGYHLLGTPASADELTPCPECGAAWNLAGYATHGKLDPNTAGSNRPSLAAYSRTIRDARGWDFELRSDLKPPECRALLSRVRRRMSATILSLPYVVAVVVLAPAVAAALNPSVLDVEGTAAVIVLSLLFTPLLIRAAIGRLHDAAVDLVISEAIGIGKCPSCHHDLSPASPGYPMLNHCTRCGAAWQPKKS
jgi:Zn-finger nucleic acid-binding protein